MQFLGRPIALLVAGALLASVVSFFAYRLERSSLVSRYEAREAELRTDLAKKRSKEFARALDLLETQRSLIQSQTDQALSSIAQIPTSLSAERLKLRSTIEEFARDPKFDCRKLALPDAVLDRLRRSGESSHSPDLDPSAAVSPVPSAVSRDTSASP